MEKYNKLCSADDCYTMVYEDDIERDENGVIFERSKICYDCRTPQDKRAIKAWRKKHKSITNHIN
jgi:hypothetical protein